MNISPITTGNYWNPLSGGVSPKESTPFMNMLQQSIKDLEQLDQVKTQDSYNLALGNVDDIGAVMVNSQKAETALQMAVQVRNKMVDAYNEIMRMNV